MNVGETVKDSLKYPFSDWKKILIFGIIIILTYIDTICYDFGGLKNLSILITLWIMGFIIFLIVWGYGFKIIKTSLNGSNELPKFDAWPVMLKDGMKILVVGIIYLIPLMIFTLIFSKVLFVYTISGILGGTPLGILELLFSGLLVAFLHGKISHVLAVEGFPLFIVLVYLIAIVPIYYVAIANMANNIGKLRTAFKLGEILNKVRNIGFKKFSIFYLLIIPLIALYWCNYANLVYLIVISLIISPYLKMFISRFIGLIYLDEIKD